MNSLLKKFWHTVLPSLLLIALVAIQALAPSEAKASPSFQYEGDWGGTLSGQIVERWNCPQGKGGTQVMTLPCQIEMAFTVKGKGTSQWDLSGIAQVTFQQPDYIVNDVMRHEVCDYVGDELVCKEEKVTVTGASLLISPTEFEVAISGSIQLDPPIIYLEFDPDPPLEHNYTVYLSNGDACSSGPAFSSYLWSFGEITYVEKKEDILGLSVSQQNPVQACCPGTYTVQAKAQIQRHPPLSLAFCTKVAGAATLSRYGQESELKENQVLGVGDIIITGDNSWIEIGILDGTCIKVDENTRLEIKELFLELERKPNIFKILWGRLWTNTRWGRHHRFETQSAVIGPRGTEFTVEAAKDGTTTLTVLEGIVGDFRLGWH